MSTSGTLGAQAFDPLLRNVDLPLSGTFYPVGFPLHIVTNSPDALAAANEAWGTFRPQFDTKPLQVRVLVQAEGDLTPEPVYRSQLHLFAVIGDRDNFALFDPSDLFGYICVSARTAADHAWFRWHLLEGVVYMMLAQRHVVPVHSACVARGGKGILLAGRSGAGKSTLAFACARNGWTYIGDDCTFLLPDSQDRVGMGKPHQVRLCADAPAIFPELQGYLTRARPNGKLAMEIPLAAFPHIRTAPKAAIDAVVMLDRRAEGPASLDAMPQADVVRILTQEGPAYGEEVWVRHQTAVSRIASAAAFRLRYNRLDEAVALLETLTCPGPQ